MQAAFLLSLLIIKPLSVFGCWHELVTFLIVQDNICNDIWTLDLTGHENLQCIQSRLTLGIQ